MLLVLAVGLIEWFNMAAARHCVELGPIVRVPYVFIQAKAVAGAASVGRRVTGFLDFNDWNDDGLLICDGNATIGLIRCRTSSRGDQPVLGSALHG